MNSGVRDSGFGIRFSLLALAAATAAAAQTVEVYSEFDRPDPFGGIVKVDRPYKPREILSPAVVRNGFASFHIAVSVPAKESYLLYVVPNPVSACRVSLYKEHFVKTAAGWIPDRLTEVQRLPDFGVMPDPDDGVPGQTTRVYLLDLWLPPNADVARFRVEVQLKVAQWTVRPMEVRVMRARVPGIEAGPDRPLPAIEQGADTAATQTLTSYLAGTPLAMPPPGETLRGILRRNAVQDIGLARPVEPGEVVRRAIELLQANSIFTPRPMGAEWWLRMRDWLFAQ
jgi:hypothetical protein